MTMAQQQGLVCVPHPFTWLVTDAKHGLVTLLQTVVRSFPSAVQCSLVCSMTAAVHCIPAGEGRPAPGRVHAAAGGQAGLPPVRHAG